MNEQINTALPDDILDRMWRFAERIAPAKFLPPQVRGDVSTVFYLLATAQDMGLAWTHMTRSAFLPSDGGLGMKGDVILSLLLQKGFDVQFDFSDKPVGCACAITRPGGQPVCRTFTMEDAARIETRWIPTEDGGRWERLAENYFYRNYPRQCCQWRALVNCARVAAADVVGGVYLPEELSEGAKSGGNGNGHVPAPAPAEEFVVAEKPEPEPEPPSNEGEKQEAAVETKAETTQPAAPVTPQGQTAEPDTKADTKPDTKPEVSFEIYGWTKGGFVLAETFSDEQRAGLRAQALANSTGEEHRVSKFDGATRQEVFLAHPPKVAAAAAGAGNGAAATTAAAEPTEPTFEDLIARIAGAIGSAAKEANKVITRYLAAHMGVPVKGLPKDRAKLLPSLVALDAVLDQRVAHLRADPEGLGEELSGRAKGPLDQEFDRLNWPDHIRMLARKMMEAKGQTEEQFRGWINHPMVGQVSITSMDIPSLEVFLPLFLLVLGRAWEPVDLAVARGWPVDKVLADMVKETGKPIEQWDAEFAGKVLDALKQVGSEPAPPQAPPSGSEEDWMLGFQG